MSSSFAPDFKAFSTHFDDFLVCVVSMSKIPTLLFWSIFKKFVLFSAINGYVFDLAWIILPCLFPDNWIDLSAPFSGLISLVLNLLLSSPTVNVLCLTRGAAKVTVLLFSCVFCLNFPLAKKSSSGWRFERSLLSRNANKPGLLILCCSAVLVELIFTPPCSVSIFLILCNLVFLSFLGFLFASSTIRRAGNVLPYQRALSSWYAISFEFERKRGSCFLKSTESTSPRICDKSSSSHAWNFLSQPIQPLPVHKIFPILVKWTLVFAYNGAVAISSLMIFF